MINNSSNLVKLILYNIILFLNVRVFVLILYWKGFKGFHYRARLGLAHAYACISWLKHVNSYSRDIQKLPLLVLFDVFFRFMMLFMCLLLKAQIYYFICAKFILYFVSPDIKKHRHKPNHTHVQTQRMYLYLCCCLRCVYLSIYVFSMWGSKKNLMIYYMITIHTI